MFRAARLAVLALLCFCLPLALATRAEAADKEAGCTCSMTALGFTACGKSQRTSPCRSSCSVRNGHDLDAPAEHRCP